MKRASQIFFQISVYNILWLLFCLLLPALLFFAGITVQGWQLPACALLAAGVMYFLTGRKKPAAASVLGWLAMVFLAVLLAYLIFNIHWDGNTYHKTAVGLLTDGWNPMRGSCMDVLPEAYRTFGMAYNAKWVDHYANGGWIISAVFASFFGNIETGKAVNLLILLSVAGILQRCLSVYLKRWGWVAAITAVSVFQPAVVSQIESFYIDGNLYLYLLLGVLAMLLLSIQNSAIQRRYPLLFLFASIVYCINIKFTGAVYIGMFCAGFYVCWLIRAARKRQFFKVFVSAGAMFAGMALFAVLVVGNSSYVGNLTDHGNPLYPLFGEGKVDIMAYSEPHTFENKNNLQKSLVSFFGKTENITSEDNRQPKLKVPFTFSLSEIKECMYTDVRVGGAGPFYSGIFLVSAVLAVLLLARCGRKLPFPTPEAGVTLFIALMMALFLPGSWWARYSAYLHFFVIAALLYLAKKWEESGGVGVRLISGAFGTVVFLNAACFLLAPAAGVYLSCDIWRQKEKMQRQKEIVVYAEPAQMTGIFWNLRDWGVLYRVSETKIEGNSVFRGHLIFKSMENEE